MTLIRSLLARQLLTRSAVRYATAGWPVLPGTWWDTSRHRYWCPEPGCRTRGLHPAHQPATTDPAVVRAWWATHPYTVLIPTGDAVDVLEVPGPLGRRVWRRLHLRGVSLPAASTPGGEWLLFTAPASTAVAVDAAPAGAVQHGTGSWVPAPPSALGRGPVRWEHAPWISDWTLPQPEPVLAVLTAPGRQPHADPHTTAHRT